MQSINGSSHAVLSGAVQSVQRMNSTCSKEMQQVFNGFMKENRSECMQPSHIQSPISSKTAEKEDSLQQLYTETGSPNSLMEVNKIKEEKTIVKSQFIKEKLDSSS